MDDLLDDIASLVQVIVEPLVTHKEDLQITSAMTDEGSILIEMRVNEEDAGKVIGRQGRVIKAIRTLARAAASRESVPVEVELID
ncbi:MAG: KH domain-containing protein [Eggerthellaceae bacterium]|nr:KH domain-containing protein [Eggerthellaceae bacterium]